jgi:hypothetical protein
MKTSNVPKEHVFIYLTVFLLWIYLFCNIPIGFKSYVDEAYFILGLQPEQNLGIQHTQFFQIARFLFRFFSISPTIIYSRIVAYICIVFTLFFFSVASYYWLVKKRKIKNTFGLYASLVFLWGSTSFTAGYEQSFTFNHLLVCFVSFLFSFYLLWDTIDRLLIRQLCILASGGFTFLLIMNYFPSGILILVTLNLLILLRKNPDRSNGISSLLLFWTGIIFGAILYNYMIFSVKEALSEIIANIINPSFGTGGYDLFSHTKRTLSYAGVFTILILCGMGIVFLLYVNQKQQIFSKTGIAIGVSVVILILIFIERKVFKYSVLLMPVTIAFAFYWLESPCVYDQNKKRIFLLAHNIRNAIFFLFPIIAVQGTNVSISYKLTYLSFMWIFVLAGYLFRIKDRTAYKFVLYLTVIFAVLLSLSGSLYIFRNVKGNLFNTKQTANDNRQFAYIRLTDNQIAYFQNVANLLEANGFDPKRDKIFTFDYDYATLLYLNAPNYGGLMHHIENMSAYKTTFSSQINEPDYIIVLKTDKNLLKEVIDRENFQWNFPGGYFAFDLASPEKSAVPNKRILFIKKNINRE